MDNNEKIIAIFANSANSLIRKLDSVLSEVRRQRTPNISVQSPEVKVNITDLATELAQNLATELAQNLKMPDIHIPPIEIPEPKAPIVKMPKIKIPKQTAPIVNVPPPNVTVEPNISVEPTPVTFPDEIKIKDFDKLLGKKGEEYKIFNEVSSEKPLPIVVLDSKGRQINDFGGEFSAPTLVGLKNNASPNAQINPATEDKQDTMITHLTSIISSLGGSSSAITPSNGRKAVAVTNTAIALGTGTFKTLWVRANTDNTGIISLGGSGVVNTEGSRTGLYLYKGEGAPPITNGRLQDWYINGTAGDNVTFVYTT